MLNTFHKRLGKLEGAVGNGLPEVVVLRGIGVVQWHVADDAERDEGYLIHVAGLGNGARLHIDSLGLREVADDFAHLFFRVHKPVGWWQQTVHSSLLTLHFYVATPGRP